MLITDKIFSGADTLGHLVRAGIGDPHARPGKPGRPRVHRQATIDGDTAGRSARHRQAHEFELLTHVSRINEFDLANRRIVVERRAERVAHQVLETPPAGALITMLEGSNEMRFGTTPNMFRAARAAVRHWDRTSAGIEDISSSVLKGSPTIVQPFFGPTPRAEKGHRSPSTWPTRTPPALRCWRRSWRNRRAPRRNSPSASPAYHEDE